MSGLAALLSDAGVAGAVIAEPDEPAVSVVARLRAVDAGFALLVIDDAVSVLDRAMMVAAIATLATECAPTGRIGAVVVDAAADRQDIADAAVFLQEARSTTGQILTIAARA